MNVDQMYNSPKVECQEKKFPFVITYWYFCLFLIISIEGPFIMVLNQWMVSILVQEWGQPIQLRSFS